MLLFPIVRKNITEHMQYNKYDGTQSPKYITYHKSQSAKDYLIYWGTDLCMNVCVLNWL